MKRHSVSGYIIFTILSSIIAAGNVCKDQVAVTYISCMAEQARKCYIIFAILSSVMDAGEAIKCLTCRGVIQPRHCTVLDTCLEGEVCFVERYTEFNTNKYNLGCLPSKYCQNNNTGQVSGACSECCQSELCNAKGCGEPGFPLQRGPVCFTCAQHSNPDNCHAITVCRPFEVCHISEKLEFEDRVFSSQCLSQNVCNMIESGSVNVVGKRSNSKWVKRYTTCSHCCNYDLCNNHCEGNFTSPTSSLTTSSTGFTQPAKGTFGTEFIIASGFTDIKETKAIITAMDTGSVAFCKAENSCQNYTVTTGRNVYSFPTLELLAMTIERKTVVVRSTVDISLLILKTHQSLDEASFYLALPVNILSNNYVTSSYRNYGHSGNNFIVITSVYDGTDVNITLRLEEKLSKYVMYKNTQYRDEDVLTIQLDKYQNFKLEVSGDDLTGTFVHSSKPVAVLSGSDLAEIRTFSTFDDSDYIAHMVQPDDCLKTKFIIPPLMSRRGFISRVISTSTNTTITINNNEKQLLSTKGSFFEYATNSSLPVTVSSDKPVLTVLYAKTGYGSDPKTSYDYGSGNMITIPGVSQYVANYSFTVPSIPKYGSYINDSYITIISKELATNTIIMDSQPLYLKLQNGTNIEKTSVVFQSTSYDIISFKINPGFHNIHSSTTQTFGVIFYGFRWANGFGSPVYLNC